MAHDCTLPQRLQACFRCRGRDLITHLDAGDVVCRSCGEIQRDRIIDNTDEVRSYLDDDSNKDRESRTSGIPERNGLRGSSFKTMFVNGGSSARGGGDYCSSLNRSTEMLERADERMAGLLASHIEKVCNSLKLTSSRVMTLADQLGLRVTQERCPSVFGSSSSSSSSLRRSQVQLLATSLVYLICRQEGCGRTLEEMTAACPGVDKSSLGRMHGALARELRLPPARVAPADLVNRLASHARLSPVTSIRARHVCQEVSKYSLCQSLSPQLVAAAALVLVGLASRQETINLTSLAQGTLSCSIPQIRKVYLTLRTHATLLLPADVQSSFGDIALLPLSLAIFPDTIPPLGVGGAGVVKRSRSGSGSGSGSHSLQTSSTGGETLGEGERGGKLKKQSTAKSGVGGVGV